MTTPSPTSRSTWDRPSSWRLRSAGWAPTGRCAWPWARGALVGTVGLVSELAWVTLWGREASGRLPFELGLKIAILGPLAAVAAAVLGAAFGNAVAKTRESLPVAALVGAGVVLLGVVAFPLPRNVGPVSATVRLEQVGSMANVEVVLDPPDAARNANAFAVSSWQGGSEIVQADLTPAGPGRYLSSRPVPVTGSWKTMVSLQRGDEVMAVPLYLPADPEIGAPAVPALPERTERLVRNTTVLLREVRPGPAGAAVAAYSGLAALVAIWVALIVVAARRVPPPSSPWPPADGWSAAHRSPAARVASSAP